MTPQGSPHRIGQLPRSRTSAKRSGTPSWKHNAHIKDAVDIESRVDQKLPVLLGQTLLKPAKRFLTVALKMEFQRSHSNV